MYTLILPHVDRAGRHTADALELSGLCFTRLRYSEETVEVGLSDLARVGLIVLYEVGGRSLARGCGLSHTQHAPRART